MKAEERTYIKSKRTPTRTATKLEGNTVLPIYGDILLGKKDSQLIKKIKMKIRNLFFKKRKKIEALLMFQFSFVF